VVRASDGDDVRTTEALALIRDLRDAISDAEVADTLVERPGQPPIVSFLDPAEEALEQQGGSADDLDDDQVRALQDEAIAQLPDEIAALTEELLADQDPPSAGLVLVFQDTRGLDEDAVLERQAALVDVVGQVTVPEGLALSPLSVELLLDDNDIGPEIGRLFGTALAIILLVLALVYWTRPAPGRRAAMVRRTVADVGLTLVTILFAVVWMQGIGVLLGPDYAGLIGYFDSQTQIVPILVVALGVDFAIHLLARYRTEAGASSDPGRGYVVAFGTVGVALLLDSTTTAIGFLTNLFSPVDFLATLGVLAASGIVAAFVLTMTFLPAARILLDRRALDRRRLPTDALTASGSSTVPRVMGRTVWLAERVPVPTLLVALAMTGVGIYGFTQLDSRFELTDFVPQDDPQLEVFAFVDEVFDGGFGEQTEVLLTGELATPEALEALVTSLEQSAEVDGVRTLDDAPDATSVVSVLEEALEDEQSAAALAELGIDEGLQVDGDADVDAVYELLLDVSGGEEVLAQGDDGWQSRVELRTSVDQADALVLRDELLDAFAPLVDAGVEVFPTSQELVQASVAEEIEAAQLLSILVALGAVMLLLAVFYGWRRRQPIVGVLTVLPIGFVLAATFGMMAATGIPLNPVTATLAALSIGIGVPFTIHVTNRYLEERDGSADGIEALRQAVGETGGAVVGSALTTAIGFGVLTTSTLLPFEQLGYVIVYAIVLSGIAATLVLPSLLALWDRRARGT
jgi:hydrophobe/amphiphile efflux-3 (HAE3) family protein